MRTKTAFFNLLGTSLLMLSILIIFLSTGCGYKHQVSVYQNGKHLGEWTVSTSGSELFEKPKTAEGKRLRIYPADGIRLDSVWYRSGAVVVQTRRTN